MAILSQESFTIRRLIDGKTISLVLQSNRALTQVFTPDPATYLPNYAASPYLVVTPALTVSGTSGNQIGKLKTAPTWKINGTTIGTTNVAAFSAQMAAASPYALTIKKNMEAIAQMDITFEGIYVQPVTLIEIAVSAQISFTKSTNAGAALWAQAWASPGSVFMNDQEETAEAKCEIIRGSDSGTANATFQWQRLIGGVWTNMTTANSPNITDFGTHTMTVKAKAITNRERFKCVVTDTLAGSSTNGKTVAAYVDFVDMSDPYELKVETPLGDGIAAGGSTMARFQCYQGGTKMAPGFFTGKTLKVFRYNAAGEHDTTWGTSGYKNPDANRELIITENDLLTGLAQTGFGVQLEG